MVFSTTNSTTNSNSHQQHPTSSSRSLHSQVHDAVSVTRDRFADVVSHVRPSGAGGLKEGWDAMVKVMFAPCAGDIGGVPRDEMANVCTPPRGGGSIKAGGSGSSSKKLASPSAPWAASVPFEVSASQLDRSLLQGSSFLSENVGGTNTGRMVPPSTSQHYPMQQQRVTTPREQRSANSRAKLRQLGARHQLASGFPGESLADTARPISPHAHRSEQQQQMLGIGNTASQSDLVDFDDGISAISSHTLEEMERRRHAKEKRNVVRLHPLDFSQIIDEEAEIRFEEGSGRLSEVVEEEVEEKNTEVVFGEPFYEEERYRAEEGAVGKELYRVEDMNRTRSTRTHETQTTNVTEESNEFEEMHKRHEAMYWVDQDQVANTERDARGVRIRHRPQQRMSIEERARRLRELSRSRSRSDGTGSSNKSGTSSLVSGQHPHDTVPVFSSDLFGRRQKSSSGRPRKSASVASSQYSSEFVPGSLTPASQESDPFACLDYGEI